MMRWNTITEDAGRFLRALGRGVGRHADLARSRRWQDRPVEHLVAYAANHVPFYRQLFRDHAIDPRTVRTVEDLHRIPITDKATLKRLPLRDRCSDRYDPDRLIRHSTSGSSGIPFQIRRTWIDERCMNVFTVRRMMGQGIRPADRIAILQLNGRTPSGDRLFIQKALARFGVFRMERINCMLAVDEVLRELVLLRPDHLMGYGWAILRLADAYERSGRRGFRPKAVHPFGEVVNPAMRRQLSQAFECPVFDIYGSYEFGMAAFECTHHHHYHVSDDSLYLEVLRDGIPVNEGETGVITGTNLMAYAMPFIRFEIGDLATRGPDTCPCGFAGSTISQLRGRMIDMFPLPDGRSIHPYEIVVILLNRAGDRIFQYQLVQETETHIVLYLVPSNAALALSDFTGLAGEVERVLGEQVRFEIRLVEGIDFERSGKFRVSRSKVASGYDGQDAL